jgi:hypothetical protein
MWTVRVLDLKAPEIAETYSENFVEVDEAMKRYIEQIRIHRSAVPDRLLGTYVVTNFLEVVELHYDLYVQQVLGVQGDSFVVGRYLMLIHPADVD